MGGGRGADQSGCVEEMGEEREEERKSEYVEGMGGGVV